ncbi:MAG: PLD nuclease N-terminal domain-containing protein [Candidatus Promineifilaceae bacterium]
MDALGINLGYLLIQLLFMGGLWAVVTVPALVLLARRDLNSSRTILWTLIIVFMPFFGMIFFLLGNPRPIHEPRK